LENQHTSDPSKQGVIRPTFLTVLCILTFIGSGWGIINSMNGYMSADSAAAIGTQALDSARNEIVKQGENTPGAQVAEKVISGASQMLDPVKMKKNAMYGVLANILTLAGGFLMFQLRKPGYWLYLLGTAISVITPLMIFGATNLLSIGMTAVLGFVGVVFAAMYATNLKHMH
jgi:hypothetical protein